MAATGRAARLAAAVKRPLPLPYHPLYRFYEGGAKTRAFRGITHRPDDWWSEDWVGSCTLANNTGPQGQPQGLSTVDIPGEGPVTLLELAQTLPGDTVGERFAQEWGPGTGVLVKLLSPAGQVPTTGGPKTGWGRARWPTTPTRRAGRRA